MLQWILALTLLAQVSVGQAKPASHPNMSLAPLLKQTMPCVVNLLIEGTHTVNVSHDAHPNLKVKHFKRVGSGVIIDAKHGYIVTNAHVIHHAGSIVVTLHDGRHLLGHTQGVDKATDLAVIRVKAKGLKRMTQISTHKVQVGDFVTAIGNPFGLEQTVTSGIVSGLHRHVGIEGLENFIQTDAPINPGNSGGALVNMKGELVGINTAILGPGGNIGIGFAIPITMARPVIDQLIRFGNVERGALGIVAQNLTPALADALGVPGLDGAIVNRTFPNSSAIKAGIRAGDIITAVNNTPIISSAELRSYLGVIRAKSNVHLRIQRGNQTLHIHATLAPIAPITRRIKSPLAGLGLRQFDQLTPLAERITGVQVTRVLPASPASLSGIRPGDVILKLNGKRTKSLTAILQITQALQTKRMLLLVQRQQNRVFLVIGG